MECVRFFEDINRSDIEIAGGKGASLGELTNAGMPVPLGFVILVKCFDSFVSKTGIAEELLSQVSKIRDTEDKERVSSDIRTLILSQQMPEDIGGEILDAHRRLGSPYVAIRSSATAEDGQEHAWAGQFETYLNIREEEVLEHVKKCWASVFSSRVLAYRTEKGVADIAMAVVVQSMVDAEVSGVAFSVHPVTSEQHHVVIEAAYGLGEAIVSGQITPDYYVVEKGTGTITQREVRPKERGIFQTSEGTDWKDIETDKVSKPALSDAKIDELATLVEKIEKHYGFPVDVEWSLQDEVLYILQSRPITTLAESNFDTRPHARDFVFMFEAEGVTPLFQEIVSKSYRPSESLLLCVKSTVRSFISKETLHRMRREGVEFFSDISRVERTLADLDSLIMQASAEMAAFAENKLVTIEDAHRCFQMMEDIHALYGFFDTAYTDGAFEAGDDICKLGLELVEKHKNPIRERYNELFFVEEGGFISFLGAIAREHDMSINDLCWCLEMEIIEILNGGILPVHSIAHRKQAYVFHKKKSETTFLEGDVAIAFVESFEDVVPSAITDILGTPAHAIGGIVRGRVCVINSDYFDHEKVQKQMAAMEKGSVLVSVTTAPDLMEAIQKSAAIVTDTGGMLSHAAITARELNIPCVVGTQFASKVLKDGDLVEVDAARGVVRIIV